MNKQPIPYNKRLKGFAKHMRKNMPPKEGKFWYMFLKYVRPDFHRQRMIGNYIVDFHCPKAMLIIEIDGIQHGEEAAIEYDKKRTEYLESLGYKVVRYSTYRINYNLPEVISGFPVLMETRLQEIGSSEKFKMSDQYEPPF